MIKAKLVLALALLAALMAVAPMIAWGQIDPRVDALLVRLQSTSIDTRIAAAQDVFGGGFASPKLYTRIAGHVELGLVDLRQTTAHANELAWLTKALASSGDMRYLPLIERVERAGYRRLAGHAIEAKRVLFRAAELGRPYLLASKVPLISEEQARRCEWLAQENCQTRRSDAQCAAHHQSRAVLIGGNAVQLLHSTSRSMHLQSTQLANLYQCPW